MSAKAVGLVAVLLLMTPGMLAAQSVTVRVYNNFGVSTDDFQVARTEADGILQAAGIEVAWMDCWFRDREPVEASPACRQAPGSTDLVLRLQGNTDTADAKYISMGFSLVSEGRDTAYLSTVFANLVWGVARGAAVNPRTLLGMAMAHELGHLLLNTNSHAKAGLMRAGWSRDEMRRHTDSDWRFLDTEAAKMREAIEARASASAN